MVWTGTSAISKDLRDHCSLGTSQVLNGASNGITCDSMDQGPVLPKDLGTSVDSGTWGGKGNSSQVLNNITCLNTMAQPVGQWRSVDSRTSQVFNGMTIFF